MGKWAARIGLYYISFPDFHVSGLPETSAKRDTFDKRNVKVDYVFLGDKFNDRYEKTFNFNLTEIIPLKKERGRYSLDYDKLDLEKTLWNILMQKKIEIWINPYLVAANYNDPSKSSIYYLNSRIQLRYIELSSLKPAPFQLSSYKDIEWLTKNNLRYDQCY